MLSIMTTGLGPRVSATSAGAPGETEIVVDLTAARSKLSSTAGAMDSATLTEDGEFALVALGAQSAVLAFRSGNTIYGVSSNTTRTA